MSWNPLCHLEGKCNYPINQQCEVKTWHASIIVSVWQYEHQYDTKICTFMCNAKQLPLSDILSLAKLMLLQDNTSAIWTAERLLGHRGSSKEREYSQVSMTLSDTCAALQPLCRHCIDPSKRFQRDFTHALYQCQVIRTFLRVSGGSHVTENIWIKHREKVAFNPDNWTIYTWEIILLHYIKLFY